MVRYFLTDLRGNPIYSFAQRLRRTHHRNLQAQQRLSLQLQQRQQQRQANNNNNNSPFAEEGTLLDSTTTTMIENHADFVTTTLVCMVRNRAWEDALKRVVSHPHEVYVVDVITGNTVLHAACRLNPPAAIILALATPQTARHANYEGATPLHIAASHRCSKPAIQALLDVCHEISSTAAAAAASEQQRAIENNDADDEERDPRDIYGSTTRRVPRGDDDDKHTSPTADLSRMGRAPIHYACMSFRGLEIDAFRLLLDATLSEGNVWVWDRHNSNEYDELSGCYGVDSSTTNRVVLETANEETEYHCELDYLEEEQKLFDQERDRELYMQPSDDLTVDDSKTNGQAIKVLVNVMGIKDATGQTPLGLLFRRYRERVRCVINTVDRLRRENQDQHPELAAALRVHADLGELWEKARWIVARLTEERLQREQCEEEQQQQQHENDGANMSTTKLSFRREEPPPKHPDATSRRATYFGSKASSFYDTTKTVEPPSPAEAAVAHEAASWAAELHQTRGRTPKENLLMLAPNVTTERPDSPSGRHFRIVHASVGLTGYGCPPELIRLAISIHPNQVMEMDEDGNLPLHIAVTAASYLATAHAAAFRDDHHPSSIMAAAAVAAGTDADDHSVLSDAAMSFFSSATVSQTTNPFDKVIKILLQQYPEAARMSQGKTGKLPLVLAIESRRRTWADGIRTLLNAYPPALHNKKIIEPVLYPDVLALVGRNNTIDNHRCDIDFAGCRDLLPVAEERGMNSHSHNHPDDDRRGGRHRSKRAIRQDACSRTTLFELLRTKPEWLTRSSDLELNYE